MNETLRVCLCCHKEFIPKSERQQKFCCPSCGVKYHNEKRKPLKEHRECVICGKGFTPWNKKQVTCGRKDCTRAYSLIQKKKKRGVYKYAKNGGLTMPPPTPQKKKKHWADCTPEERWEQMTWVELSAELARLRLKYGQAQVLKQQGKLPDDFGKRCR